MPAFLNMAMARHVHGRRHQHEPSSPSIARSIRTFIDGSQDCDSRTMWSRGLPADAGCGQRFGLAGVMPAAAS